ncbi:MAG TPA: hypothetical protein VF600_13110 [Abditibacteriaceae bacterium]|jgi:uncharacterized membrane protein YeaQ/YmgE (transglycosylase-associated protein family)
MEMLFSIMSGVFVGWLAGRAMGYDEYGRIVTICFAGAGAIAVALVWTIVADRIVGTSASIEWIIAGIVGGVAGLIVHRAISFVINVLAPRDQHHTDAQHGTVHPTEISRH